MKRFRAGVIAFLILACGCGSLPNLERSGAPPIVLISIDTLRSDRLPAYGYKSGVTPAIDRLAGDGILYEKVYCHVPLTLPSHASLFTGKLPREHGVRDNAGYSLAADDGPTLAESLKAAGYATGAAVSSFVLRSGTGLDRGFDFYEDGIEFSTQTAMGGLERPGRETLAASLDWLRSRADEPFFLFLHLYEPHAPYAPPEPFASRVAAAYDGEIAAADDVVGRLLEELDRLGIYEDSTIVLTSDHGEGLGDHGEQEHGLLLYREALQVPLIVKLPGSRRGGTAVGTPAQLNDLFATILQVAGVDGPFGADNRSLLEPVDRSRSLYAESYYPRLHFGWSEQLSLIRDGFHYIEGPEPELYALEEDPHERNDLIEDRREIHRAFAAELSETDHEFLRPETVDPETRDKLASLGYVGSVADSDGPLPSPRNHLDLLDDLRSGVAEYVAGRHESAAHRLRSVVDSNPRVLDAWDYLARSLTASGDERQALEAYEAAMRLSGGARSIALSAAKLYLNLGDLERASAHAELGRDADPAAALGILAQIARRQGRLDEARHLASQAVDTDQARVGPRLTLAEVLLATGDYEQVLDLADTVRREFDARDRQDPQLIRGLDFLRGQALANLGRPGEAEAAFLEEIKRFPRDTQTYTHLAVLYGIVGRPEQATAALKRMLEVRPVPHSYAEAVRTMRVLGDELSAKRLLEAARRRFPENEELLSLGSPSGG